MKQILTLLCILWMPHLLLAQDYGQAIHQARAAKLQAWAASADAPVQAENIKLLDFFAVDASFKVEARLEYLHNEAPFKMPTSDGTSKTFKRYARLHFVLQGKPLVLTAYQSAALFQKPQQAKHLFLPFLDPTNGGSSYPGGRYIDLSTDDIVKGSITIDFNTAYNPYCAYSNGYRCPQPPPENKLPLDITAGEKIYLGPKSQRTVNTQPTAAFSPAEIALIQNGDTNSKMYVLQTTAPADIATLEATSEDIAFDDPHIALLAARMLTTVRHPDHPGVGIAAPQVGINKNLIWVQRFDKTDQPFEWYINPKIIWRSKLLRQGAEGCLSIPDRRENIVRNYTIKIQYQNQKGQLIEELVEGFTAVIFQHEVDHLYGILYPERLQEQQQRQLLELSEKPIFMMEEKQLIP